MVKVPPLISIPFTFVNMEMAVKENTDKEGKDVKSRDVSLMDQ